MSLFCDTARPHTSYVRRYNSVERVIVAPKFNFEESERQLREYLDGKFFSTDGEDQIEKMLLARNQREREKSDKIFQLEAMEEARAAAAAEAAAELERRRKLFPGATVSSIIAAVAYAHSVNINDILSLGRSRQIVHARMHAIYLAKEITGKAYTYIGARFGRDHSTVMHALKVWPKRAEQFAAQDRIARLKLG